MDVQIEMGVQFPSEIAVEPVPPKPGSEPAHETLPRVRLKADTTYDRFGFHLRRFAASADKNAGHSVRLGGCPSYVVSGL